MTELREVIHTMRVIAGASGENIPVHKHSQHFTPGGELIVEWCEWDEDCEYVKKNLDLTD